MFREDLSYECICNIHSGSIIVGWNNTLSSDKRSMTTRIDVNPPERGNRSITSMPSDWERLQKSVGAMTVGFVAHAEDALRDKVLAISAEVSME